MFGGSQLDMSPVLPLKLLVIYCLKVRYLVRLMWKRPSKIKTKNLFIKYDLFVTCALFTEILLPTPFPSAQIE